MKITLIEHEGCFAFDLEAETTADAALLVRFGVNRTDKINAAGVQANANGTFTGHLVFAKSKHANNDIPKRH